MTVSASLFYTSIIVSTPFESYPAEILEPAIVDAPPPVNSIEPDNPAWSLFSALFVWLASMVFLIAIPTLGVLAYFLYKYKLSDLRQFGQIMAADQSAMIVASLIAIIPAHLLTLLLVWTVVTGFGKRPFWQSIGWSWSPRVGFGTSLGIALFMLLIGLLITKLIGGSETQLDQIISSSLAARFATAILAAGTAPLVEELVYRGILYSALQRLTGKLWAVVGVSALFTLVHVFQYSNNLGVIAAIALLSLTLTATRALTGRLLPCFIIHFIFNGVQAVTIMAEPYLKTASENGSAKSGFIILTSLLQSLRLL